MKDSGVQWIGLIPDDWEIVRLRFLCNVSTGNQDTQDAENNGQYNFYVRSPIIEKSNSYTFDCEGILMAGDGAGAGRVFHHAFGKYAVHQRVYCFHNFNKVNTRFFLYNISNMFPNLMDMGSAQSTVPSVRLPMIQDYPFSIPNLSIQNKIADFLDRKCSEIQSAIDNTKKTIEEYKKLKQAVITKAVTKGIRENRKLKDSGIDWIGQIPEEWEVCKLKPFLKWKSVKGFGNETVLSLYRDLGVVPKDSRDDNHNVTSLDTDSYKLVEVGDFVINKMKAWQGSMAISNYRGIVSPAYHICSIESNKIHKPYFHHLMRNKSYLPEYKRLSGGLRIGQWDLAFDDFCQIKFLIPSLEEQQEIADYLDKKCSQIDTLISQKEQFITELEKYKQSLIYEYVTGKKEVK